MSYQFLLFVIVNICCFFAVKCIVNTEDYEVRVVVQVVLNVHELFDSFNNS